MSNGVFPLRPMSLLVDRINNPVTVEADTMYEQIGIRSHGKGIFYKDSVSGKALGNKRVFWVEPDCFVVNIVFAWEQAVAKTQKSDLGKIASHRFPMYRPKPDLVDLDYLTYLFRTELGKHLLTLASPGGAGRNKTLGQAEFMRIQIPCPPVAEQKQIVRILSTWDSAIEATKSLVSNSKAQKVALLQQLLTGEKRLARFSKDWSTSTLSEVAEIIVSNVDKKSSPTELPVRLCNYTDVYSRSRIEANQDFMTATATPSQVKKFALCVDDVLITKDSETPNDIAVPSIVKSTSEDLLCGYHLAIIRPGNRVVGSFLKFYFELKSTRSYFASRANGATRFGLPVSAIEQVPLRLPTIQEQTAIASILESAELEIDTRTSLLQSLRDERSALIQQLLTGKRRVKVREEKAA
jgi:type I restriction enzyme, S subunit